MNTVLIDCRPMASTLLFPAMATLAIIFMQPAASESKLNMVLYMHDNFSGSNETAFPVAGLNGSSDPFKFGTLVAMSDVITKQPQVTESDAGNIVGRGQGTYVNTNLVTGHDTLMVFTIIFQNMEYNGSTLEIQGTDRFDLPEREWAVVGGTGKFRFARGYLLVTTESVSVSRGNAVLKLNINLRTH